MTTAKFNGEENHETFQELVCSAKLTAGLHIQLKCISVLNIFLSVTSFLGNTLILVALHKASSLHPPSKLLFRNLATTDLCVGIIVEPLIITYWMSVINERWKICRYAFTLTFIMGYILTAVSLFTLTAISVDRLLALLLGLRYRQVVTLKRTYLTVFVIWVVSIVGATMYLRHYLITEWYAYIVTSILLTTSTFSYTKIFRTLRHHQIRVQDHVNQGQLSQRIPPNIARYRKTVSSALWVQLTLVVCYLPYCVIEALVTQRRLTSSIYLASSITVTLAYLNSSLNPILYCWKIKEVRRAVKDTIRRLFCSST